MAMIGELRKVLKRLHYPVEVMLVCARWHCEQPGSLAASCNAPASSSYGPHRTTIGRNFPFGANTPCKRRGQPVISVDTKKKELVGPYKNNGPVIWSPKNGRHEVCYFDFLECKS